MFWLAFLPVIWVQIASQALIIPGHILQAMVYRTEGFRNAWVHKSKAENLASLISRERVSKGYLLIFVASD